MSPDLNLIENLWCELKSAVEEKKPANVQELEQFAKKEWEKIPAESCKKLIDGYKKRLEAVITAKRLCNQILKRGAIIAAHAVSTVFSLKSQYVS